MRSKMNKKPSEKEIIKELEHLKHIESCFLTLYVSLMVTGLTLFVSLEKIDYLQKSSFIMFIFSLLFSINHLRAIVFNNIEQRINAFLWDVGFFLILIIMFSVTFLTQILVSFSNVYPSIGLISLIVALLSITIGFVIIQRYVSRRVIPIFRKKIFPVLSHNKNLENPFISK